MICQIKNKLNINYEEYIKKTNKYIVFLIKYYLIDK